MNLYLIRHARTQPTDSSAPEWPLSEAGKTDAKTLAAASFWSRVSRVYSSPEPKALSTVQPAARLHSLPLVIRPCLREVERPDIWIGDYEGTVRAYLDRNVPDPEGWESHEVASERIVRCIHAIEDESQTTDVAICGHGLSFTLYAVHLANVIEKPYDFWRSIGFASVAVVSESKLSIGFGDLAELALDEGRQHM